MLKDFNRDLAIGKRAEVIVYNLLSSLGYHVEDVSNNCLFYYSGDLKVIDKDKEYFIEVKNDSRIVDTGNVLCEIEVYYKNSGYYGKGNMDSDCDIYTVVSEVDSKVYFIDFSILKKIYKYGEYKEIEHKQQTTYCYLLPIGVIKKMGGLIGVVDYSENDLKGVA